MSRAVISKTNTQLLRSCKEISSTRLIFQCHFSSAAAVKQPEKSKKGGRIEVDWVPHPRTGIYIPRGHEWVLNDVPGNPASLNQTCWLRNVDGVLEKPDPDTDTSHHLYLTTNLY